MTGFSSLSSMIYFLELQITVHSLGLLNSIINGADFINLFVKSGFVIFPYTES